LDRESAAVKADGAKAADGATRNVVANAQGNAEPTDAELERGILDAFRRGLDDVARTLAAQLEDRRRARVPGNVVNLATRRGSRP